MKHHASTCLGLLAMSGLSLLLAGCRSPLERTADEALREHLIAINKKYADAIGSTDAVELSRPRSDVEDQLSRERIEGLDDRSGPRFYRDRSLQLGPDLNGQAGGAEVGMTLQQAIESAVSNSLEVQVSKLLPGAAQASLVQAEAVFDAVVFANFQFSTLDTPRPSSDVEEFGSSQSEDWTLTYGIRKALSTGGQIELSSEIGRTWSSPSFFEDPSYYPSNIAINVQQPLLRNFGSDINRANILLARNASRRADQDLKLQLLNTVLTVEQAYWNLAVSRYNLMVRRQLLERTMQDRRILEARQAIDVTPATLTDVNARVESRRTDVIRAEAQVRLSSDTLKRLMNDPNLPLTGETVINPIDGPIDMPLTYSYLDAISTALRQRPEILAVLSEIDDATIRQRVADNARLPVLNLLATMRYNGIGDNAGDSYSNLTEGDYIDYLIGLQFEQPLGNRAANALYRQRELERRATVLNYQRTAQDITLEVKDALRQLETSYRLVGATRATRRAAAENVRTLLVQEEAGDALTPEFIDLKLRRQEALADAEYQELRSVADYNIAIARFYQTVGTLLERNNIRVEPEAAN